jgi:hypothetical protein
MDPRPVKRTGGASLGGYATSTDDDFADALMTRESYE